MVCFFYCWVWEVFVYSRYLFFLRSGRYVAGKYFLLVCSLFLPPLNRVFHRTKVLILMKSNVSFLPFIECVGNKSTNSLPSPRSYIQSLMFSPKSFIVLHISPLYILSYFLCKLWDLFLGSFFTSCFRTTCWKDFLYSIEEHCTLSEPSWVCLGGSLFWPLDVCIYSSMNSQYCFSYSSSWFSYVHDLVYTAKLCWNFYSNYIKTVYQFGENWYLLLCCNFQMMVCLSSYCDFLWFLSSALYQF